MGVLKRVARAYPVVALCNTCRGKTPGTMRCPVHDVVGEGGLTLRLHGFPGLRDDQDRVGVMIAGKRVMVARAHQHSSRCVVLSLGPASGPGQLQGPVTRLKPAREVVFSGRTFSVYWLNRVPDPVVVEGAASRTDVARSPSVTTSRTGSATHQLVTSRTGSTTHPLVTSDRADVATRTQRPGINVTAYPDKTAYSTQISCGCCGKLRPACVGAETPDLCSGCLKRPREEVEGGCKEKTRRKATGASATNSVSMESDGLSLEPPQF